MDTQSGRHAVQRGYDKGQLVATTFRLFGNPPGADPTATVLLDSFVSTAVA